MTSFAMSQEQFKCLAKKSLAHSGPLDSVVFLLCLEGSPDADPEWSGTEIFIDKLVQLAQPSPAITHCELVLPPSCSEDDMHFATYLGLKAGFGKSFGGQRSFYLGRNAALWRAVPISCANAARRLRKECEMHEATPYSIARYLCSAPPLRALAGLLPDAVGSPAHCATLTARVLKRALPEIAPRHASAWYGPSTLFLESQQGEIQEKSTQFMTESQSMLSLDEQEAETRALHVLLNERDEAVCSLSDDDCQCAIRSLTQRALEPGLDEVARRLVQKQLATALLRYSIAKRSGK